MSAKQIIFVVCVVLMSVNSAHAKSWRGLEPLRSTRADVLRLWGNPIDEKSPYRWTYDFAEGRASIQFSSGAPCEEGLPDGWRVPKDTVLEIDIYLSVPKKMTEVLTANKEYERVQTVHTPDLNYYIDADEGIRLTVYDELVTNVRYGPSAKNKEYRCGEYKYAAPVLPGAKLKSVEHYPLDEFGNIRYEDAKARLDNFVIQLFMLQEQEPEWRGYIVVYAARRSHIGEAQFKAKCYKNYLVRVRKMNPAKLFAVDGGYREDAQAQLYLGRADYYPPVLMPTVSPKKVQVINRRLRSCNQ
jgi:hypothetical protein